MYLLIYMFFIHFYTSQSRTPNKHVFVKTVNLGGNIVFGPIPTDKYCEIRWFYNHHYQIIFWNYTKTLYNDTNAKLVTSFPFRVNISNAQLSDAGNYTVRIEGCNGKYDKYPFQLVVNYTVNDTPTILSHVSCSSSLLSNKCVVSGILVSTILIFVYF
ncbi:protein E50 [Elephant endotheliotropic herpesvirus 6]|nr:protein E50 [Elephant endotheliotropic herpesvirus 6]